jgi:hypothetical protein
VNNKESTFVDSFINGVPYEKYKDSTDFDGYSSTDLAGASYHCDILLCNWQ